MNTLTEILTAFRTSNPTADRLADEAAKADNARAAKVAFNAIQTERKAIRADRKAVPARSAAAVAARKDREEDAIANITKVAQ